MMGRSGVVSEGKDLLVDHQAEHAKHGAMAVVELNGTLWELDLLIKVILAKVDASVVEVANMLIFGSRNIAHKADLQPTNEGKCNV